MDPGLQILLGPSSRCAFEGSHFRLGLRREYGCFDSQNGVLCQVFWQIFLAYGLCQACKLHSTKQSLDTERIRSEHLLFYVAFTGVPVSIWQVETYSTLNLQSL